MACGGVACELKNLMTQIGACCPCDGGLLCDLTELVNQIGDSCCKPAACQEAPCCIPMTKPFAQVCITCPPPILAPTYPQTVKPLQLPCPVQCCQREMSQEEAEQKRYANYYNNYNIDYRDEADPNKCRPKVEPKWPGPKRECEDYQKEEGGPLPGCPTGFKPCTMRMMGPCNGDPNAVWCAQVQPCPPKPKKKKDATYHPGPCTRPCCKHWKPKEGPCLYDDPCKADCFNHPPGMKPSGRFP